MPFLLLFSIVVVAILVLLANVALQHFVNKIFNIHATTFWRVALVVFLMLGTSLIISGIGFFLGATIFKLVAIVGSYVIGTVLYHKYFQTGFWKSVLVLFVGNIAALILLVVVVVALRGFLFEPFLVDGNSMAPAYPSGEYIVIEKVDKSVKVGNVIIAAIQGSQGAYDVIARVAGVSGDTINDVSVPQGDMYLTKDNPTATSTYMISKNAVVGKPILDLGQTNWHASASI